MSVCKYQGKSFIGSRTLYPSFFHDYMILLSDDGRCILGRSLEDTESKVDYSGKIITVDGESFIVLNDDITYNDALSKVESYRETSKQVFDYYRNLRGSR